MRHHPTRMTSPTMICRFERPKEIAMIDSPLTIPQRTDPIARGLVLCLLAALLGLAVALPAPSTEASAPIVIIATPALAMLPLAARLDTPTTVLPTEAPTDAPGSQRLAAPASAPTISP